jgi:hypothetical protein
MTHLTYTADQLVEQPALQLLTELGWQVSNARDEVFCSGGTLSCKRKVDMVLVECLATLVYRRLFQTRHRTQNLLLPCLLARQLHVGEQHI